jgi:transcriptional regulator with XRE-family HTH domain
MDRFPRTLKAWRTARRLSQLDLALEAEVSARHLSFLETGRARPSREMIVRLGDALLLPLNARNQMLTAAGFAPRYVGRAWEAEEMAPIRKAIDLMLARHDPYPALAFDRLWTVRQMNWAAQRLYGMFGVGVGDSLLDLLMSGRIATGVENWPEVARHAAARLRTESIAQGGVAELDRPRRIWAASRGAARPPAR